MRQRPDRFVSVPFAPFRSAEASITFARPLCTPVLLSDTECYTLQTGPRLLVFKHLPTFDADAEGLMDDEDLRQVQWILIQNPVAGVVVPGAGGVRKLRVPLTGR